MALFDGIRRRRERRRDPGIDPTAPYTPEQEAASRRLSGLAGDEGGRYGNDRQNMMGLYGQYGDLASGQGPSLATEMHNAATQRNIAATIAAMGSARGGNLAANQTAAATAGAGMGQAAAMDLSQIRAQEQLAAMDAQAALGAQMAGLSSQRELGLLGLHQTGLQGLAGMTQDQQLARAQLIEQMRQRRQQGILGGLQLGAQVGGDVLGGVLSDERMKTDIEPAPRGSLAERLAEFAESPESGRSGASEILGKVKPFEFAYTDEGRERGGVDGRIPGVMAQDLRAAGGPVDEDEDGTLRIPGAKGLSLALAAGADHERRLRALEGG